MNAVVFLLPVAIGIATVFLAFFLWAARGGQFDDLDDPPTRMLSEGDAHPPFIHLRAPREPRDL